MKKLEQKKLILNKKTVSTLTNNEMTVINGASLLGPCTVSCSVFDVCCDTVKQCDTKPTLNIVLLTVVISNIC